MVRSDFISVINKSVLSQRQVISGFVVFYSRWIYRLVVFSHMNNGLGLNWQFFKSNEGRCFLFKIGISRAVIVQGYLSFSIARLSLVHKIAAGV